MKKLGSFWQSQMKLCSWFTHSTEEAGVTFTLLYKELMNMAVLVTLVLHYVSFLNIHTVVIWCLLLLLLSLSFSWEEMARGRPAHSKVLLWSLTWIFTCISFAVLGLWLQHKLIGSYMFIPHWWRKKYISVLWSTQFFAAGESGHIHGKHE